MAKKRKPISFDTTLRNPERIPQFISILSKYEGKVLDDETTLRLEAEIIQKKIFKPSKDTLGTYVKEYHDKFNFWPEDKSKAAEEKVKRYYAEWKKSKLGEMDIEKIIYLLKNTITRHNEKGWNGGWESRVHTQFNFLNELGLVRVIKGRKVELSKNGKMMIKCYKDGYIVKDNYNDAYERSAFLNAFAKYQINNPYRKNTIDVNFFPLVLNVIEYLDKKYNRPGIYIQDIPFISTWGNNDYKALAELIYEFRRKFGYNTSNELVYEYAMNLLDESTPNNILAPASREFLLKKHKDYKFSKIIFETPDEVIRKLRLTRLISLRGAGRFIDINRKEYSKIKYIIENYSQSKEFEDEDEFFAYMGKIDESLMFEIDEVETEEEKDIKERTIENWAHEKDWEFLKEEMKNVSKRNSPTNDETLKYIKATARLEFLTSIVLKKALPRLKVMPNYVTDDQGIPFNTAAGENSQNTGADIDVYEDNIHAIVEPTLSSARAFQVEHELPTIRAHLMTTYEKEKEEDKIKEWFAIFLAPKVQKDVGNQVAVIKQLNNAEIFPWETEDFIGFSKDITSIKDYKQIRSYAEKQVIGNGR